MSGARAPAVVNAKRESALRAPTVRAVVLVDVTWLPVATATAAGIAGAADSPMAAAIRNRLDRPVALVAAMATDRVRAATAIRPGVTTVDAARTGRAMSAGTPVGEADSPRATAVPGRTGRPAMLAIATGSDRVRAVGATRSRAGGPPETAAVVVTPAQIVIVGRAAAGTGVAAAVPAAATTRIGAADSPVGIRGRGMTVTGGVDPVVVATGTGRVRDGGVVRRAEARPVAACPVAVAGNRRALAVIRPAAGRSAVISFRVAGIPVGPRRGGPRRPGPIRCGSWLGMCCELCGSGMLTRIWCCRGCFGSGTSVGATPPWRRN
ncbi:hypothetical protein NSK11_contig00027-0029 [Nocardia seriolae]|uniref:Uncharacterized protein n=1 Tax=Nocardia seriolae TaxID=37332 RepID=A0ABC9YRS9_9NOCA|nr:hypothetical protein NSERKGN1266_36360 [Nocardia seriolae]BEK95248.1 hypothetical protein NSER024013_31540 [Nocardia seriolae]GAM45992.1 hypothetical protein NS07_v2contig00022-0013 [Nocardia seriolae]GAP28075.1 hypothetical protein NSK11_contig00027-0029 [Nocardia seriolae]GEM25827.1 hypothetical protein NS2_40660 [Nocardia seriolae NBRC 15557]